ncbi:MAG TPA: peptidoglycan binding domain-containing protein, partial [Anaerolineae bacterium]|nr:peptidoglycan binding domain-containing protein [Anaerolineae bacterium]
MANARATTPPTVQPQSAKSSWFGTLLRVLLILLTLIVWMAAVFAIGSVAYYQREHQNRIYDGVSVRGIDMSGLTLAEARERLSVAFDPYPLAPVVVRYGDQSWTLTAADLGVNFDADSAAAAAYEIGRRQGGGLEFTDQIAALQANLQEQLSAYRFGREVLADEAVDRSAGLAWLEARAREINRPVAEATLRVDGQDVISTASQTGYALDVSAS